jgi:hypothetical protein
MMFERIDHVETVTDQLDLSGPRCAGGENASSPQVSRELATSGRAISKRARFSQGAFVPRRQVKRPAVGALSSHATEVQS